MQLNLNVHFWAGFIVTVASAIAGGTVHLTNAVPADWIPVVTAWSSIIAMIGGGYLTVMSQQTSPPVLPPVEVAKATLAESTAAAKALVAFLAIGLTLGLGWPGAAHAQGHLTGNPIKDIGTAVTARQQSATATTNAGIDDLVDKIQKLSLPDFQYALAMSKATKNVISTPCWQSWVDLITAQQAPVVDSGGQPVTEPSPHIITDIERLSELLAILRPDSTVTTSCAALAGAAGKDVATLVGGILSGGALGLFKLPIPIP